VISLTRFDEINSAEKAGKKKKIFEKILEKKGKIHFLHSPFSRQLASTMAKGKNMVVSGHLAGHLAGDLAGHLVGDLAGHLVGDLVGDLAGDLVGHLAGHFGLMNKKLRIL
jgi:hypothetical protein